MPVHELRHPATGEEVKAETGLGRITKVEPGARNAKVTIISDNPAVRIPLVSYAEQLGPVWERVQYAWNNQTTIWYRIDVHRKAKVNPATPLAELALTEKVRDLVAIERPQEAPTTLTIDGVPAAAPAPNAQTHTASPWAASDAAPVDDPWSTVASGPEPPPAQGAESNAVRDAGRAREAAVAAVYEAAAALAVNGGSQRLLNTLSDEALAAGATRDVVLAARERGGEEGAERAQRQAASRNRLAQGVSAARDPDRVGERAPAPPAMTEPGRGGGSPGASAYLGMGFRSGFSTRPVASDNRPWDLTNSDGRPNLSSYAADGVMELVTVAGKLRVARTRSLHEQDPTVPLDPPTETQVFQLAKHLLHLADTIQHRARGGGRVDRNVKSHRLARQAVREAIHVYPIPWGADTDGMAAWSELMITYGTALLNVTWRLFAGDTGEQRTDPTGRGEGGGGQRNR